MTPQRAIAAILMGSDTDPPTVAIREAAAKNTGYLPAQILSLADTSLAKMVRDERDENRQAIVAMDTGRDY